MNRSPEPDEQAGRPRPEKERDRGPGAHSGHESRAQERTVPGTASAGEGYGPQAGTADNDPLAGVEAAPGEVDAPAAEEAGLPGAGEVRRSSPGDADDADATKGGDGRDDG
jgi:hypothetical protein